MSEIRGSQKTVWVFHFMSEIIRDTQMAVWVIHFLSEIIRDTQMTVWVIHFVSEIIRGMTNHHLEIARTGKEGLKLIIEQMPDLVLLDLGLPDMDGYEILERIRAHPQAKKIPAIAMTAKAMMDDVERGERAGFNDYLIKPVKASELLKSMQVIIDEV